MDFNASERRAVWGAAVLVTLASAARFVATPAPGQLTWEGATPAMGTQTILGAVDSALQVEARASRPLASGERIDLNTADEPELRRLPGVGAVRARAIIAERKRARFGAVAELERVPGVGPATLARLAPRLTVGGAIDRPPSDTDATHGGRCEASRVNINGAPPSRLASLPGIGPARAAAIVDTRRRRPFASVDELTRVHGIGPATLERLRPRVCVANR